jgi:hypothetical protein
MLVHDTHELPILEISLSHAGYAISTSAVVDTGAMVSVLPYDLEMQLGVVYAISDQTKQVIASNKSLARNFQKDFDRISSKSLKRNVVLLRIDKTKKKSLTCLLIQVITFLGGDL